MTNSCALRSTVRSPDRNRFLASCWVMVEPPTTLGSTLRPPGGCCWARASARASARWLRSQAFSSEAQSTPVWLTKAASSLAITARLRWTEMRSASTHCWLHSMRPCVLSRRQASLRWKVVDSGSTQRMASTRAAKLSCRASTHTPTSSSRRTKWRISRPATPLKALLPGAHARRAAPVRCRAARRARSRRPRPPVAPACPSHPAARPHGVQPRPERGRLRCRT